MKIQKKSEDHSIVLPLVSVTLSKPINMNGVSFTRVQIYIQYIVGCYIHQFLTLEVYSNVHSATVCSINVIM